MTFTELVNEVYSWTKRPDMIAQTESAVRSATLKYHRKEKFWRDLAVVTPVLAPATVQLVDLAAECPRFRQVAYVRIPASANQPETFLDIVDANDLLDADGYAKDNIAFFAGTQLNIKSSWAPSSIEICYWKDPLVTPAVSYTSWIADTQPDLLIASAAARIFAFDNENEIFRAATMEEAAQWQELQQNNTEVIGR